MTTSSPFRVPKDGAIYTESVFRRCRDLIRYHIWSGIELNRLDAWIANFKTTEERYFAARVLDALIYRSDKQTTALLKQLFQRVIPDLVRLSRLNTRLENLQETLTSATDPGVRIVPIIPSRSSVTKSGPSIGRMLRRNLRFHDAWIIHPDQVLNHIAGVAGFVFVDDFLGTGKQFTDFLNWTELASHMNRSCFVATTLAGHSKGVETIRTNFPDLHVDVVELLNDDNALFSDSSGTFPDDVNSAGSARDFYYELLTLAECQHKRPRPARVRPLRVDVRF